MAIYQEDPFQKIVNVGWPSKDIYAVITRYSHVGNDCFVKLVPDGLELGHPALPDYSPDRTDPAPGPAFAFPPSDEMVAFYRQWTEEYMFAEQIEPERVQTILANIVNIKNIVAPALVDDTFVTCQLLHDPFSGEFAGNASKFVTKITCRLFNHVKLVKNQIGTIGGFIEIPIDANAILPQPGRAEPIFEVVVEGNHNTEFRTAQPIINVVINKVAKTATIDPLI